ncbi:MAG: PD40 domain-containing protein [Nitrospirae bacterium]|nr:PD40 domain-containing protein [Nitrospirota bacterium]
MKHIHLVLALLLLAPSVAHARNIYGTHNHGDLQWYTHETQHFVIYYHKGKSSSEWTARKLASMADQVYDTVTDHYAYKFKEKIHLVVRDTEEIANGWAIASQDWMTIWGTNLYTVTRGRSDWIKNVFHHEFAHIVSIKAANPFNKHFPGLAVIGSLAVQQKLGKDKFGSPLDSPDELTSPVPSDAGFVFLFPGEIVPPWYAEGVAQYAATAAGFESYDTHREMLLRSATLENNLLTLDEMNTFDGKGSLQMEMIYNQGFNFIGFVSDKYRNDAAGALAKAQGKGWHLVFDSRFPKIFNKSRAVLYGEWKQNLQEKYGKLQAEVQANPYAGEEVDFFKTKDEKEPERPSDLRRFRFRKKGLLNRFVRFSPDGKYFGLLSTRGADRWGTSLYLCKTSPGPDEEACSEVEDASANSQYAFSPDSKKLAFTTEIEGEHGETNEIFVYDIEKERLTMMDGKRTHALTAEWQFNKNRPPYRAVDLDWSPDGQWIVYTENLDGQKNLRLIRPDGTAKTKLSSFEDGTQIGGPMWAADGKSLLFYMYHHDQQDLWLMEMKTLKMRPLTYDKTDDRDPIFTPEGTVIFASDRTGIFNLYELDPKTNQLKQLTNVVTGAFWPSLSPDGKTIYYSYYTSYGYRTYKMDRSAAYNKPVGKLDIPPVTIGREEMEVASEFPELRKKPYTFDARPWEFYPELSAINQEIDVGGMFSIGDFLDRHELSLYGRVGFPDIVPFYSANYRLSLFWPDINISYRGFVISGEASLPYVDNDGNTQRVTVEDNSAGDFGGLDLTFPLRPNHRLTTGYLLRRISESLKGNSLTNQTFFGNNLLGWQLAQDSLAYADAFGEQSFCFDYDEEGKIVDFSTACKLGNSQTVLLNHQLSLGYRYAFSRNIVDGDVNPRGGRDFAFTYSYTLAQISQSTKLAQKNFLGRWRFFQDGNEQDVLKSPTDDYNYNQFLLTYSEYLASPIKYISSALESLRHTFIARVYFGLNDRPTLGYDKFQAGGRLPLFSGNLFSPVFPLYGYEDGSVTGDMLAILNAEYRFPLAREINAQAGPFYFESLYGSFLFDIGNAYDLKKSYSPVFDSNGDGSAFNDLLTDVGFFLNLKSYIFHGRPWFSMLGVAKGLSDNQGDSLSLGCDTEDCSDLVDQERGTLNWKRISKPEAALRVYLGLGVSF